MMINKKQRKGFIIFALACLYGYSGGGGGGGGDTASSSSGSSSQVIEVEPTKQIIFNPKNQEFPDVV